MKKAFNNEKLQKENLTLLNEEFYFQNKKFCELNQKVKKLETSKQNRLIRDSQQKLEELKKLISPYETSKCLKKSRISIPCTNYFSAIKEKKVEKFMQERYLFINIFFIIIYVCILL